MGWIYEYALVDRTGGHDLAQLRALQDWFLKYELKALPNVAEVATVGGMVRQYQVVVDPARLKAYNLPLAKVIAAIRDANREAGGSVVELAEAEYMVRTRGYLKSLDDFRAIPVQVVRRRHAGAAARTSRASSSGPKCAAASPSSTAKARSSAASSCCARARTRGRRSRRSRRGSSS